VAVHTKDFVILACIVFDTIAQCDRRTDASTIAKTRE